MKISCKKEKIIQLISILFIAVLCLWNIKSLDYPIVLNDEFGYWGNAITLAGKNWGDLIARTPYYSWGYSIWLVPLAFFIKSPLLLYKASILLNLLFLWISYFLCYKCAKQLFPKLNSIILSCISCVVIIFPANILYSEASWTESLLCLLTWISFWLMIQLDKKFSAGKFILLLFIAAYMYMVHQRTIGIVAVTILCLILILVKHKKSWWYGILVFAIIFGGYKGFSILKGIQLDQIWKNSEASSLNDVSLSGGVISQYISVLINHFIEFIQSLGAKLFYIILSTGFTVIPLCINYAKELKKKIEKNNIWIDYTVSKFWAILCLITMWGICSIQMFNWADRKDVLVYARYMENAIGPVLLLGLISLLYSNRKTIFGTVIGGFGISLIALPLIMSKIKMAEGSFNTVCSPFIGAFFQWIRDWTRVEISISFYIIIILSIILFIAQLKEIRQRAILIIGTFLIAYSMIGVFSEDFLSGVRNNVENNIWPIADQLAGYYEDEPIYYVVNNEYDEYAVNPKYLQFQIPDRTIHVIPEDELKEFIKNNKENKVILIDPKDEEARKLLDKKKNKYQYVIETSFLAMYAKE